MAKETSKTKIWVWQNEGVVHHAEHAFFLRNQTGIEAINKNIHLKKIKLTNSVGNATEYAKSALAKIRTP